MLMIITADANSFMRKTYSKNKTKQENSLIFTVVLQKGGIGIYHDSSGSDVLLL